MVQYGFDKADLDFSLGCFLLNFYPDLEFSILNFQFSIAFFSQRPKKARPHNWLYLRV